MKDARLHTGRVPSSLRRCAGWVLAFLLTVTVFLPPGGASAQVARAVVLVDFVDESAEGWMVRVDRLPSSYLPRLLADTPGLRLIAGDPVRAALRTHGWQPVDMVSLARSVELGMALGAQWVVTGRWITAEVTLLPDEPPSGAGRPIHCEGLARAGVEVRVVEVADRRVILHDVFGGHAFGLPSRILLLQAAEEALRNFGVAARRL